MARRAKVRGITVRQERRLPQAEAKIDTRNQSRRAQADPMASDPDAVAKVAAQMDMGDPDENVGGYPRSIHRLMQLAQHNGNLCDLIPLAVVGRIGEDAIREWNDDEGTRQKWVRQAEAGLDEAAQEDDGAVDGRTGKDTPWEDASNINYPILTKAAMDWNARAYPELVKGDQVVRPRTFAPAAQQPSPDSQMQPPPGPQGQQNPQVALEQAQAIQAAVKADQDRQNNNQAREARAKRISDFVNHTIFYEMDNWEEETDLLFAQMPTIGQGFKKVYMAPHGVQSDFVSALDLCVDNDRTKSLSRAPRTTQPFERYPYEITEMIRMGRWNDVDLPVIGNDPQAPRELIEQNRVEDLDGDGMEEPYIVIVDTQTRQVLSIEAAYTVDDVYIDEDHKPPRVLRFERWQSYANFKFLPDPRGKFYGMGFARLLGAITDAVDTALNQMMDANTAAIAGGGFVASGVRLAGGGQGGQLYTRPGEYQDVSVAGGDIRTAIWERTAPNVGPATMQLMELLLAAAKDLASVKDVLSGEGPQNAPVGTTLAIQQQAMQAFTAVFKRVYRGFRQEATLIYKCLKRWGRPQDKAKYLELTGGDWDADFEGDDMDMELVADPNVVSHVMKMARIQAMTQLAESAVGQAAGMLQPGPAQTLAKESLQTMDVDRPERFIAQAPPNPEVQAKVAEMTASAAQKTAGAHLDVQKAQHLEAEANLDRANSLHSLALASRETHGLHMEAQAMAQGDAAADVQGDEVNEAQNAPPAPPGGSGPTTGPGAAPSPAQGADGPPPGP